LKIKRANSDYFFKVIKTYTKATVILKQRYGSIVERLPFSLSMRALGGTEQNLNKNKFKFSGE
jgi:hypothetical protein